MSVSLQGSMVAIVTPFTHDAIDEAAFKRLIETHIKEGTSAIVPCGTTGESATLSFAEHDHVIELAVQYARGRISVIAGTGSNNTREAIRLTKHAKEAGADAALLISPYYNKPTQRGLFLHFKAISEAIDIPLVVYNIASRTAVNIEPETFAQLATLQNIVAVKESSGNLEQMSRILQLTKGKLTLLSGDDGLTLPVLAIGGKGVISVVANLVPRDVAAMVNAYLAGKQDEALQWHQRLLPLVKALFLETNPIPVKTAMGLLGMIEPGLRLPLCEMSDANEERLLQALEAYGLLNTGAGGKPAPVVRTNKRAEVRGRRSDVRRK